MSNNDDMDFFNEHDYREVTFDEIINEIEIELNKTEEYYPLIERIIKAYDNSLLKD